VSEKRVNIKITASISDFEKAIKKAQKEIKDLADSIEDINKDKFGSELEKQLKDVTEAAEKMKEQMDEVKDSLEDLDKVKFDKLEKEFKNIAESAEDLKDALKDVIDNLEDLDKAKMDKVEDAIGDVVEKVEELGDEIKDTTRYAEDATDSMKGLGNAVEDIDDTKIENLGESMKDVDKYTDNAADSMKDFNSEIKEVDNSKFNEIGESVKDTNQGMENLKENVSEFNSELKKVDSLDEVLGGDNTIKLEGSGNTLSDFISNYAGTLMGTSKLSNDIQDLTDHMDNLFDSMKDMNQFTFEEQVKNYDDIIKKAIEAQDKYNETLEKSNELTEKIAETQKKIDYASEKELQPKIDEQKKLKEEYEERKADIEEFLGNINKYNDAVADWANRNEIATKALEDQEKVVQDLEKEYNESAEGVKDYDKVLNDLVERVHDLGRSFDDLNFDSKLAKGLGNELKNMNFDNFKDGIHKLDYVGNTFDDTANKIIDNIEKLNGILDKANISAYTDEIQGLIKEYRDLWDAFGSEDAPDDALERMRDALDGIGELSFAEGYESLNKWADKIREGFELAEKLDDAWAKLEEIAKDNSAAMNEYDNSINKVRESQEKLNKLQEEQSKLNQSEIDVAKLEGERQVWAEMYNDIIKAAEALGIADKSLEEIQEEFDLTAYNIDVMTQNIEILEKALDDARKEVAENSKELETLNADLGALNEALDKSNKLANDSADAFDKEYKMYEKLSKKVKEYLEDESKSILLREKVAKSFKQVSDAMEKVYADSSKLNNVDLINKTLEDAAKYIKELDIVSTENLQADLERLGKIIDDKTQKIKRFKELNKEFGSDDGKAAYGLEKEAEAIEEFTKKMGFAIEAADTLRKAWGDVSIGDEDHLKIRARAEALSTYGETIKKQVREIRKAHQELDSLDDIYNSDKVTDDEKLVIEDYKAWEKSREELNKYNEAIQDYITIIKDAGGNIDDKFLTDGKFDVDKFIESFEKMGTSTMVLSKQINAIKAALLENIKAQKEAAQNAVKNAEANLEAAKANQQAAQTTEEIAEAQRKVTEAEKELAEAKEKSKKVDRERIDEAKKLIEAFNEQAEALRKLGIAVEDISKADISKFDKSLGTLLDGMDAFGDDKPKNLGDFLEDIKALFASFDSFDLGDIGDGLKDIFSGIPSEIKLVIAAVTALITALNKLYETGKQQFFEGLQKGFDVISKIGDIARDIGSEVKDAFEDITGTNLDWSSLMAIGPEFEYQMEKVGAIAGSNEQQLERLIKKAEELGGTTQFKASEVGEAFEYMAMAGYDTEEMLDSIDGTLALSIGSGTDLAKTTDIVTDYMTALGLEANSTSDFVDKLAATITSSNTTVEKWGQTMKNVASQAGALGISMTDLSTAIGLQANAGVKGAKAGTALKNILANMNAPTEKQAAALKELGFTPDENGSYLITDKDGNVDLDATVRQLMEATKDMDKSQKTALLTAVAGKEALPGLMALLSQGVEGWDELSNTIENSTGKVQFWNECMSLVGKSGEEAVKTIDNMKEVFAELEYEGLNAGLSSEELSHAIAILGDNGKVTADDVRGLINVIDSMNTATGEAEEAWRALDGAGDDVINTGYDYDATIAKLMADTSGLSQKTKDNIKDQLKNAKTYEEANKILKEYELTAERTSFANATYAEKLEYLRDNLKGCTDEQIKTKLANLGLSDSFEEVLEVVRMSDEEFAKYKENLESVKGMAESLSEAMDETTRAGLLELASAIENVAIAAFNKLEPVINNAVEALNEFFETWHNGEKNEFTFDGFEIALGDITKKIQEAQPQLQEAIVGLFSNIDRFINEGSLESILTIGTSIIDGICDGILQAEENGTLDSAIDGAIKKISNWIIENAPKIQEVGLKILEALIEGIENNEKLIGEALDALCEVMSTWVDTSGTLKAQIGKFADSFADLAVKSIASSIKSKASELWSAFFGSWEYDGDLTQDDMNGLLDNFSPSKLLGDGVGWVGKKIGEGAKGIWNWFTGESYAAEIEEPGTTTTKTTSDKKNSNNKQKKTETTKKLDQVEVETLVNIDKKELSEVENALVQLQTAAESAAGAVRKNFVSMANVARNQMLNISNIIRNQAINWANIINNQAKNARDGFTKQMISMASVARTQLVNISNIIRNQSLSWYNVINNQAKNARDAFTRQMMSMVKVARNQMYNVLNTVRSYMSQISSATNKSINLRVNKTTTSNIGGGGTLPTMPAMASALYAANNASTYSLNATGLSSRAASATSGFNSSSSGTRGAEEGQIIHTHVYLEGREIAKASAKYMNSEIKTINKRENRKRGVK
jgi:TP901 family phage tail tape measure protein